MQTSSIERPSCSSVRPKRSEHIAPDQQQNQVKSFRSLLSLFIDNINYLTKMHRDCLGDYQYYPRIKISRQEQTSLAQTLENVYQKQEQKLSKDSLTRNAYIIKNYESYLNCYKGKFPNTTIENKELDLAQSQFLQTEDDKCVFVKSFSRKTFSSMSSTPLKRPLSSSILAKQRTTSNYSQTNQQNLQFVKIKTISAHMAINPERQQNCIIMISNRVKQEGRSTVRKTFFHGQKRAQQLKNQQEYKTSDEPAFNGKEIFINDKKIRNGQFYKSEGKRIEAGVLTKLSGKRMLSIKFTHRKSIDQIEKMQIQNRIMLVNSVLSVNLAQSQGYRPKSRCWQNHFN